MDSEVPENRDFVRELKNGLEHVFGDSLKSFELEMRRENQPMFSIHGPVHGFTRDNYILTIHVNLNVVELMKNRSRSSLLNWMKLFTVGDITPQSIAHTKDNNGLSTVLRAEYNISDLSNFIQELDNVAWNRFNTVFTEQLEKVLSDDKENN